MNQTVKLDRPQNRSNQRLELIFVVSPLKQAAIRRKSKDWLAHKSG